MKKMTKRQGKRWGWEREEWVIIWIKIKLCKYEIGEFVTSK